MEPVTPEIITATGNASWPVIIAAVFTSLSGLLGGIITLVFNLRDKARKEEAAARQAETAQAIELMNAKAEAAARELALIKAQTERAAASAASASQHAQQAVAKVEEKAQERSVQVGEVKAELDGLRTEVREHAVAANNYSGKIADAVEGTRQLREDFQSKQP